MWERRSTAPLEQPDRSGLTIPAHLRSRLRSYLFPDRFLPLSTERAPFQGLPDDLVSLVASRALAEPERRGRLSQAVRNVCGQISSTPPFPVTFEAHIDLTFLDDTLRRNLIEIGFEPDNFAVMRPEIYLHHFSLQYVCDGRRPNLHLVNRSVERAAATAAALIENHPISAGYVETEVYRHEYGATFAHRPEEDFLVDCERLPFSLRPVAEDGNGVGSSSSSARRNHRAADIHVKIPGRFRHGSARGAPAKDAPCPETQLARLLEAAGFYGILSEAGNYLYGAHFAELAEANVSYRILRDFVGSSGGAVAVTREICTGLWRKSDDSSGLFSPVPPLTRMLLTGHEPAESVRAGARRSQAPTGGL